MAITSRALAFASRWFDEATVRSTFEPLIADWQREWQNAPRARRALISLRGIAAFACAVTILSPRILTTPTPATLAYRVVTRIAVLCAIAGGALSIPIMRSPNTQWVDTPWPLTVLLMALPIGVMMSFPFAMIGAVDAIRQDPAPANVERATAVKLAIGAAIFMLLMQGVIAPFANQRWRELSTPEGWNTPPPTFAQSSTWALLTHPDRHTAMVRGNYTRAGEIRRQLTSRTIMSILPAILVWLRWTSLSGKRRLWPLPAAVMTVLVVVVFLSAAFAGFKLEFELGLPVGSGMWLPLVVVMVWGVTQQCLVSDLTTPTPTPNHPGT